MGLALSLGLAPLAHGSGFLIYEHGAGAMGMAGVFVSIGNNATTVFHNPAGMSWLEGTQVSLGGTYHYSQGLAEPSQLARLRPTGTSSRSTRRSWPRIST